MLFWQNFICLAKIIVSKNTLNLNSTSHVFRTKVLCVGKLRIMTEIIFHNRNFSRIDTIGQNSAATVIQLIVRNHSTALLAHRHYF